MRRTPNESLVKQAGTSTGNLSENPSRHGLRCGDGRFHVVSGSSRMGSESHTSGWIVTRKEFLHTCGVSLAGLTVAPFGHAAPEEKKNVLVRFGIVTDSHYADADTRGTRFYRESVPKMAECVALMNRLEVAFLIELGDFKDQSSPPDEGAALSYLRTIERVFSRFRGRRYHVAGNHDMDCISKPQFLHEVLNSGVPRDRSYYSFNCPGVHFVVLDANYRLDGSDYDRGNFDWTETLIPPAELAWLKKDLAAATGPTIVFCHQLLDEDTGPYFVNNAADVRRVLTDSGHVLAVLQGHHHTGRYKCIEGIHYYTLKAMVEGQGPQNNAYATVEVLNSRGLCITGYRKAVSRPLAGPDAGSPT